MEKLEAWQVCWREGVASALSIAELEALADGLRHNDPALVQGDVAFSARENVLPEPLCVQACAVGYALWKGRGLRTVSQVKEAFKHLAASAARSPDPFLSWFDNTHLAIVRKRLLPEVEATLEKRRTQA